MKTTIRLNAFHKNSSDSYSRTIRISTAEEFFKEEASFLDSLPFARFYTKHEYVDGDEIPGLEDEVI